MPTRNGALLGALYGEVGRGRPPACPHPGPFVPHLSNAPISGSVTEHLPPKGTVNQCPLVGDRVIVHPHPGEPVPLSLRVPAADHSLQTKKGF